MNALLERKAALAEDTMIKAIAPVMRKRAEMRRKADRIARINASLQKAGIPLRVVQ
jgi:hypothetical protein